MKLLEAPNTGISITSHILINSIIASILLFIRDEYNAFSAVSVCLHYRVSEKKCARTKFPRLKWIKGNCNMKLTLLSQMNSWLWMPFISAKLDVAIRRYVPLFAECDTKLTTFVDRLYWFRWIQLNRRVKCLRIMTLHLHSGWISNNTIEIGMCNVNSDIATDCCILNFLSDQKLL